MININDFYDVIVIGGGPAGSVTARYAAENGASVLMLERDREVGIPVRCGEGVSHQGIEPFIEIEDRFIATTITAARLFNSKGEFVDIEDMAKGYVLERRIFDNALADKACSFGAKLLTKANATGLMFEGKKIVGVKFTMLGKDYEVKCNVVIGADGVESRVGRWAGIDTKLALEDLETCFQYTLSGIDVPTDRGQFYFHVPGGYVWIFPKSKTTANVGIGIAGHLSGEKNAKAYLDEFVAEKFPNAAITYSVAGGVPTATMLKKPYADNVMIVGDSARQVNPITGGGIVQVMIAGAIAGKTAAEAVKKNDFSEKVMKSYAKEWSKILGKNQKFMHNIKEDFFLKQNEKFDKLIESCQKLPKGKLTVKELFYQAVKGHPLLLAQMATSFVISRFKS
jgi:digeranylgeranylglycerophospholipid reductase